MSVKSSLTVMFEAPFARRWSLTVSFFVQILHQSGALCKTNLNTLLCKVSFLFRAFLL